MQEPINPDNNPISNWDNSTSQNAQSNSSDPSHPDGVFMQNGAIMSVKNGQSSTLDQDITFDNGVRILRDGTYIKKDGTKQRLQEGQHLDTSGNLISRNENSETITDQDRNIPNKLNY